MHKHFLSAYGRRCATYQCGLRLAQGRAGQRFGLPSLQLSLLAFVGRAGQGSVAQRPVTICMYACFRADGRPAPTRYLSSLPVFVRPRSITRIIRGQFDAAKEFNSGRTGCQALLRNQ